MEAPSHLQPAFTTDTMSSPHFLNPEDLHNDASPSPDFEYDGEEGGDISMTQASPSHVIVHSKPAKKRKSWGQALPEPKTALPPRKRAKTDDEKEQRRIERIKRNRAAAHNSRERKRAETETLAVALARANAELQAYRQLHGPLPSHVVLPEVTLINEDIDTPAPSLIESQGTLDTSPSPASPPEKNFNLITIKEEPCDSTLPILPPALSNLDAKPLLSSLDPTQHSAVMLCDLQCRSSPARKQQLSPASTTSTSANWWATLILYLTMLQLQTTYRTLLLAIWSLSPSRMARLMQASTHRLTSRSKTSSTAQLLLRSTVMAQLNAATDRPAQQGAAFAALQRSSGNVTRTRVEAAASRQRQLDYQQRQAFGERRRDDSKDGTGDENGGV